MAFNSSRLERDVGNRQREQRKKKLQPKAEASKQQTQTGIKTLAVDIANR